MWQIITDKRFFPTLLIALDLCACIRYGIEPGQWRKSVYWFAAAALTTTVTW